jgi:beta-lactamase class A
VSRYVHPPMRVRRRRRPLWRRLPLGPLSLLLLALLGVLSLLTFAIQHRPQAVMPSVRAALPSVSADLPAISNVLPPVPSVAPSIATATGGLLLDDLRLVAASTRAQVAVVVIDLRGSQPVRTELNGNRTFSAASTYKFPLLMANAERIAAGTMKSSDRLCFSPAQAEEGWFADYDPGECFTRQTLSARAGTYSDNTAGRMLIDNLGGSRALNAYARSRGATQSSFYFPNKTTASDLAALWTSEAQGHAGGQRAQQWLYPLLTKTAFEDGIPGGLPQSTRVVHKIGVIDTTVIDAGLVVGPRGRYVVAIATDGIAGDAGWALVARLSKVVWQHESK